MANKTQVNQFNVITGELYDEVDTISEELIDENYAEVEAAINRLNSKLKQLKTDITHEEV